MHVAFALMIGWQLARIVRWRIARWFWALYPLLITFVIVATANHFIFDAVLGALTAGVAAYVADRLAPPRPQARRLEPPPALAAQHPRATARASLLQSPPSRNAQHAAA